MPMQHRSLIYFQYRIKVIGVHFYMILTGVFLFWIHIFCTFVFIGLFLQPGTVDVWVSDWV